MKNWRKSLHEGLQGFAAPRVLSFSDITHLADGAKPGLTVKAVRNFVKEAEHVGVLKPVRKGLWVNLSAVPSPSVAEAAFRMREGAVVSLQTVLGDAGVLNNYASQVYAVLPISGPARPFTAPIQAAGTVFHFRSMQKSVLEAGDLSDRLVPMMHYPRATAEAAVVHWIYLAGSKGSPMTMPDTQCDVSGLDVDRLARLAGHAGVFDAAMEWMEACRVREDMDDEQVGWHGPS